MKTSAPGRVRLGVCLVALTGLVLAGCTTGNEEPSADAGNGNASGDCVIGMTQINQTAAFFTQMNEGAQEAADEAGCELHHRERQQRLGEAEQRHRELRVPGRDRAHRGRHRRQRCAAGGQRGQGRRASGSSRSTPQLEEGAVDTFVGVDNEKAGAEAGQWVIDEGLAEGASYGVVDARNSFIQNQREDSFRKVVDAAGATYTQSVERRQRPGEGGNGRAEPRHRPARPRLRLHHRRAGHRGRRRCAGRRRQRPRSSAGTSPRR